MLMGGGTPSDAEGGGFWWVLAKTRQSRDEPESKSRGLLGKKIPNSLIRVWSIDETLSTWKFDAMILWHHYFLAAPGS